jgi:putative glycosyltransferase
VALQKLNIDSFEIVFVLDGITDDSKQWLLERKMALPQIKVVELSRNFGHHYAAYAGLELSKGSILFLIDCDMEVSPLVLVDFYKKHQEQKADVVYGYQITRKGSWAERTLGGLFWKAFNALSDVKVPANVVTERLMTRKYIQALLTVRDRNLFMAGIMYWVGFEQIGMAVEKKQRQGKSSYSILKRVELLIEAVTSFSEKPLRLIFFLGLFISTITFVTGLYFLVRKLLFPEAVLTGYTSLIIAMLFGVGILTSISGILGLYLSRIFKQVNQRPTYIVKSIYE